MDKKGDEKFELRKELELHHLVAIGVGGLIGSGIFVSPVGIISHVGSIGASLFLWLLCGICQLLFALCYAEIGCRIPLSGSDYVYLKVVFGDWMACMRLWSHILVYVLVQCVFMNVFARYILDPIFLHCQIPTSLSTLAFLLCLGVAIGINSYSVRLVSKLQVVFTVAKLLALLLVIVCGIVHMSKGNLGQLEAPFEGSNYKPTSFVLGFYSGVWALSGWEYVTCIVGEIKKPQRDLRLSLMISIFIVTGVYILANIAYASVLTKEEMLSSPAVAVAFAERTLGPASWIMSVFVAVSVLGSSMGMALAASRVFQMGAKNNHMPEVLSMISVNLRTPVPCLIFMAIVQLLGLTSEKVIYLMELVGFQVLLYQILVVSALMILRRRDPNPEGVVKAPVCVPEIATIVLLLFIGVTLYQRPLASALVIFGQLVFYTVFYFLCIVWKKKPKQYFKLKESFTKLVQKTMLVLPEDNNDKADL